MSRYPFPSYSLTMLYLKESSTALILRSFGSISATSVSLTLNMTFFRVSPPFHSWEMPKRIGKKVPLIYLLFTIILAVIKDVIKVTTTVTAKFGEH